MSNATRRSSTVWRSEVPDAGREQKAAVLTVRIARNHPLPDGNKRLAWQSLTIFLALNDHGLETTADDAVTLMLGIAAGDIDEHAAETWIRERITPSD